MGDAVQLKSGGPIMTVIDLKDNKAVCMYFDNKQQQLYATVPVVALQLYEPGIGFA